MTLQDYLSRREFVAMGLGVAASATLPAFAASTDLATLTLKQAADLIRRRDVSPVELTQACLNRIDKYNPSINAFITVTRDQALATAREMEADQKRGKLRDRKSTRLNSSHGYISYAVFCLKKKRRTLAMPGKCAP